MKKPDDEDGLYFHVVIALTIVLSFLYFMFSLLVDSRLPNTAEAAQIMCVRKAWTTEERVRCLQAKP